MALVTMKVDQVDERRSTKSLVSRESNVVKEMPTLSTPLANVPFMKGEAAQTESESAE